YGAAMTRRSEQMNELSSSGKQDISSAKKLAALSAGDMGMFVRRIEAELPTFGDRWKHAVQCSIKAATLSVTDFKPQDDESREAKIKELNDLLNSLNTAAAAMDEMESGTATFRDSIQRFPRLSVVLNKEKRRGVD